MNKKNKLLLDLFPANFKSNVLDETIDNSLIKISKIYKNNSLINPSTPELNLEKNIDKLFKDVVFKNNEGLKINTDNIRDFVKNKFFLFKNEEINLNKSKIERIKEDHMNSDLSNLYDSISKNSNINDQESRLKIFKNLYEEDFLSFNTKNGNLNISTDKIIYSQKELNYFLRNKICNGNDEYLILLESLKRKMKVLNKIKNFPLEFLRENTEVIDKMIQRLIESEKIFLLNNIKYQNMR
ncbi:MAG: hypothetical protein ACRDCG_02655 [Mycoplasmoidaceae bacterium]